MRILGIDPGSNFMGLACVEARGSKLICIGHTVAKIKSDDWGSRLKQIHHATQDAVRVWQPSAVAIEEVFFAKNAQSALKLGQARGAALAAAAILELPIFEYPATKVKQCISGSGRADKDQVFRMVKLLLGESLAKLEQIERHDASDALALAICHVQQSHFIKSIPSAKPRNKELGSAL